MMEKVYSVEFLEYTNCLNDTVSDGNKDIGKTKYIHVGRHFLVKESDIPKYQKFGKGYKSLIFVGEIEVDDEK